MFNKNQLVLISLVAFLVSVQVCSGEWIRKFKDPKCEGEHDKSQDISFITPANNCNHVGSQYFIFHSNSTDPKKVEETRNYYLIGHSDANCTKVVSEKVFGAGNCLYASQGNFVKRLSNDQKAEESGTKQAGGGENSTKQADNSKQPTSTAVSAYSLSICLVTFVAILSAGMVAM